MYGKFHMFAAMFVLAAAAGAGAPESIQPSATVAEAGKELQLVADVDVLVIGATVPGVSIAAKAKEAGLKSFVVTSKPYFGEDLTDKLRLDVGPLDYKGTIGELLRYLTLGRGNPAVPFGDISPFVAKNAFDRFMLERDIPFLAWSYACDILKDADGNAAGVVVANRNGRQAIRAKTIVDTTDRRHIARLAGTRFTEF